MACIKPSIIENSHGVVRQMIKLILTDPRQRRANLALIHSGVLTAKAITKLTL